MIVCSVLKLRLGVERLGAEACRPMSRALLYLCESTTKLYTTANFLFALRDFFLSPARCHCQISVVNTSLPGSQRLKIKQHVGTFGEFIDFFFSEWIHGLVSLMSA